MDFTISEVVFERTDGQAGDDDDSETDSDSEGSHNRRVHSGATTVSVPLNGGLISPFSGDLAAGSYDRVELDVEFVRLRGTYDGQAFDMTVPVNRELELRLSPPLVVDGTTETNVTVKLDIASWLRVNGAVIDPRSLSSSTAMSQFRDRVKASFRAMEDSDRDGDESDSDSDRWSLGSHSHGAAGEGAGRVAPMRMAARPLGPSISGAAGPPPVRERSSACCPCPARRHSPAPAPRSSRRHKRRGGR